MLVIVRGVDETAFSASVRDYSWKQIDDWKQYLTPTDRCTFRTVRRSNPNSRTSGEGYKKSKNSFTLIVPFLRHNCFTHIDIYILKEIFNCLFMSTCSTSMSIRILASFSSNPFRPLRVLSKYLMKLSQLQSLRLWRNFFAKSKSDLSLYLLLSFRKLDRTV